MYITLVTYLYTIMQNTGKSDYIRIYILDLYIKHYKMRVIFMFTITWPHRIINHNWSVAQSVGLVSESKQSKHVDSGAPHQTWTQHSHSNTCWFQHARPGDADRLGKGRNATLISGPLSVAAVLTGLLHTLWWSTTDVQYCMGFRCTTQWSDR